MLEQPTPFSPASQQVREKRSKGVFPRLPLSQAIEFLQAIFVEGEGEPVRRLTLFDRLKKKPDSGPSRMLVTVSSGGYGLTTGSYQADYLGITERGRRIAAPKNELDKFEAIYDALFANSIFAAFVARFNQRAMPNEEVATDYLKQNHGLSESDAKAFLDVVKHNVSSFGLIQEYSGRQVLVSREMALETVQQSSVLNDHEGSGGEFAPSVLLPNVNPQLVKDEAPPASGGKEPQFHFNIQIHLPENASSDAYDMIFKSIATHLLGRDSKE